MEESSGTKTLKYKSEPTKKKKMIHLRAPPVFSFFGKMVPIIFNQSLDLLCLVAFKFLVSRPDCGHERHGGGYDVIPENEDGQLQNDLITYKLLSLLSSLQSVIKNYFLFYSEMELDTVYEKKMLLYLILVL